MEIDKSTGISQPSPIVGIGYSAGGLTPCTDFFKQIPSNTNLSFVLINHKKPENESLLGEILTRHTSLPIKKIKNEMPILPGHIYIAPPGKSVEINSSKFEIEQPQNEGHKNLPIDIFFKSKVQKIFLQRNITLS